MIEHREIVSVSGKQKTIIDIVQFKINDAQNICVIGLEKGRYPELDEEDHPECIYTKLGSLEEVGFPLNVITKNSLDKENWNWEKFNNPQVIIIERINAKDTGEGNLIKKI